MEITIEITTKLRADQAAAAIEEINNQPDRQQYISYWPRVVEAVQAAARGSEEKNKSPIHFVDPNVPDSLVNALDQFTNPRSNTTPTTLLADAFLPVLEFLDCHVVDVSLYRFAALRFFFAWLERTSTLTGNNNNNNYTYAELIKLQTKPGVIATFLDRTTRLITTLEGVTNADAAEVAALGRLQQHLCRLQEQDTDPQLSLEELVAHSQEQMLGWLLTAATMGVAVAAVGTGLYLYTDVLSMSLKDLVELYKVHRGENQMK